MKISAVYFRKSRHDEDILDKDLFDRHKSILIPIAKSYGDYDVYEEIESGSDDSRLQFKLLTSNLHKYDRVIAMDIDRLSRSNLHLQRIKQDFALHSIELVLPNAIYNFKNDADLFSYDLQSMLAEYEHRSIKKRLEMGTMIAVNQGKFLRKPPYGYVKDKNNFLHVDKKEAKIVKFIFQQLSLGKSILNVTNQLIEMNVTNKSGKVFYLSHVQRIIRNEIYFGKLKFGQKNPITIENNHEAIISEVLWNDVQQKVFSRADAFGRNTNPRFTLSGLIYCGKCDKKLGINEKKGPIVTPCPNCRQSGIRENVLLECAIAEIKRQVSYKIEHLSPETLLNRVDDMQGQIKSNEKELKSLEKKSKSLLDLQLEGILTKEEFVGKRDSLNKKMENIKITISILKNSIDEMNLEKEDGKFRKINEDLKNIDGLSKVELNTFLKTFIKKIKFKRNILIEDKISSLERTFILPTVELEFLNN